MKTLLGCLLFFGLGVLLPPSPKPCPESAKASSPVVLKAKGLRVVEVSATVYYPTGQPTFDGTRLPQGKALSKVRWCALSHDLLRTTNWQYGDTLLVYGKKLPQSLWGLYILHDKTHHRLFNRIDLLTPTGTYSDRWDGVWVRKFTLNDQKL